MRTIKRKKEIKETRREATKELFKLIASSNTTRIIILAAIAIVLAVIICKCFGIFVDNIETVSYI